MTKNHVLLYSGGVDSVLCLKLLVDCKITPTLVHFRTTKLTDKHEVMIMRNAERLSPKSPILVCKTKTINYDITTTDVDKGDEIYGVCMEEDTKDNFFYPAKLAEVLYVGYYRINDGPADKTKNENPTPNDFDTTIDRLHPNTKFRFPLEFFTRLQIDELFKKLPEEVKADTLSSTRGSAAAIGAKFVEENHAIQPVVPS